MLLHRDPKTDLEIDRTLIVDPEKVWECWSNPSLLKQWYSPKPLETLDLRLTLTVGGEFYTKMGLPNGKILENRSCVVGLRRGKLLAFTDALSPGMRPRRSSFLTTVILINPDVVGTRYIAWAMHETPEQKQHHIKMGFHQSWNRAIDQLEELAQSIKLP